MLIFSIIGTYFALLLSSKRSDFLSSGLWEGEADAIVSIILLHHCLVPKQNLQLKEGTKERGESQKEERKPLPVSPAHTPVRALSLNLFDTWEENSKLTRKDKNSVHPSSLRLIFPVTTCEDYLDSAAAWRMPPRS